MPIPVIHEPVFFRIEALVVMMGVRRVEANVWHFTESLGCERPPPRVQRAIRIDDIVAIINEHLRP